MLFFGSFNPIHVGHLALAQYVLNAGKADEVRLVVSPQNPFKPVQGLAPAQDRLRMAQVATAGCNRLSVSDIELNLPTPSYTYRTLEALSTAEPDVELSILMGADNVAALPHWREAERLRQFRFLVYPRFGYEIVKPQGWQIEEIEAPRFEISSSQIRGWIAEGKEVRHFVPQQVAQYLAENNVYK